MAGFVFVKLGRRDLHKKAMIAALILSAAFLGVYLVYHYHVGSVGFAGEGLIRPVYFVILIGHIFLATLIVYMVPVTVNRALKGRRGAHRRIARWTLPIWLYVGFSGVAVYVMAFHLYPRGA